MKRHLVAIVAAAILLALPSPALGRQSASRPATSSERAALSEALFDYYFTNAALASTSIVSIRVETLPSPQPLHSRSVTKYAAIGVHALDTSGQDVGYDLALAVFYSRPSKGWRVFNDGSSNVGCDTKWYPVGQERSIMRALALTCH